jgi:hypothetical protein
LLADGSLGDAQFQPGAGKVQVAGGGFKRPQGIQGKSVTHKVSHKFFFMLAEILIACQPRDKP